MAQKEFPKDQTVNEELVTQAVEETVIPVVEEKHTGPKLQDVSSRDYVYLRRKPSLNAEVVITIPKNTTFTVTVDSSLPLKKQTFIRATYAGYTGYVGREVLG